MNKPDTSSVFRMFFQTGRFSDKELIYRKSNSSNGVGSKMVVSHGGGIYFIKDFKATTPDSRVYNAFGSAGPREDISISTDGNYAISRFTPLQMQLSGSRISFLEADLFPSSATPLGDGPATSQTGAPDIRLYDRIVEIAGGQEKSFSSDIISNLADHLSDNNTDTPQCHIPIPAAYTYFGQFIAHDMSRMDLIADSDGTHFANQRASQALDFTTLFGLPPDPGDTSDWNGTGGAWLGPAHSNGPAQFRDLPRKPNGYPATIDPRNDVSLAIAQMHVLLARFHQQISAGNPGLGDHELQDITRKSLQSVVLFDYLSRIISPEIYDDVILYGRRIVVPDARGAGHPFEVPIEFSAACFRFGHSMVRRRYKNWGSGNNADLTSLLRHVHNPYPQFSSGVADALSANRRVTMGWTENWRDMVNWPGSPAALMAAPVDTRLTGKLSDLSGALMPPGERDPAARISLAEVTLGRANQLWLPTAQQLHDHIETAVTDTPSAPTVRIANAISIAENTGLAIGDDTPLWFYTLREAELASGQLGPLAGRVVMETIHAGIELSLGSIIHRSDDDRPQVSTNIPRLTLTDVVDAAFPT